ncbi:hypothetical protein AWW66_21535 [Micromonospora rosaria]|uniref:HEXXH motif domain-containing protein n=2 Tax=Micromonospora rosaria TaxID=47874 RepID=A0A136PNL1_9ACTN|nr:hypothetical protein AWW66_21535 [Micromonospora rosaria]
MPTGTFLAIARGGGGRSAVRRLLAGQLSRNLLALREVVALSQDVGHPHAPLARHAWTLLAELRRDAPGAARAVLGYPSVSVWAVRTLAALRDGEIGAEPALLGAVVAAVALRAGTRARVVMPTAPTGAAVVALPGLGLLRRGPGDGVAKLNGGGAALPGHGTGELNGGGAELTVDGGRGLVALDGVPATPAGDARLSWQPTYRLRARGRGPVFHLDDPWALVDPAGVVPVDAAGAARWRARLAPGWRLLATRHRSSAADLAEVVSVLTPLRRDPAGRPLAALAGGGTPAELTAPLISGTFPAAVGCIALAGTGDARTIAATLVHELAHNKLAALDDLFPLVEPTAGARHPAPWRAGPRPLPALVHGLYAHVAVGGFWLRQRHHETAAGRHLARAEFVRVRAACREVAGLLRVADGLTGHGRLLVEQLDTVVAGWADRPAPGRGRPVRDRTGWRPVATRWGASVSP